MHSQTEIPGVLDIAQFFHQRIKVRVGLAHSRSATVSAMYAIHAMHTEPQHQILKSICVFHESEIAKI
jgi:hypothetical protein